MLRRLRTCAVGKPVSYSSQNVRNVTSISQRIFFLERYISILTLYLLDYALNSFESLYQKHNPSCRVKKGKVYFISSRAETVEVSCKSC